MDTKIRGKYGEDLAVSYLEQKGFELLERNYRHGHGEIDLIVLWKNQLLVFVEVKLRKSNTFGEPEIFVSRAQERLIIQTAEHYIYAINWQKDIRFDILAITGDTAIQIEDAFH